MRIVSLPDVVTISRESAVSGRDYDLNDRIRVCSACAAAACVWKIDVVLTLCARRGAARPLRISYQTERVYRVVSPSGQREYCEKSFTRLDTHTQHTHLRARAERIGVRGALLH